MKISRHKPLLLLLTVWLTIAACQRVPGPEKRYPIKGKIVSVDKRGSVVTVAHEAIPDYMEAMTMPFTLKDPSLLDVMAVGDRLQATLVVAGTRSWLEEVIVVSETKSEGGIDANSAEPKAGDDIRDFSLVNQDGKRIKLRDYRGRGVVLTFIYTRCPLPDYCPLMTERFLAIEKALRAEPGLYPRTHLLSVTVDPAYDTPRVLREYATREWTASFGDSRPAFSHWEFATGSADQVKQVATSFGLQYWEEGDQIIHSLRTAVIGPDGKLLRLFPGNEWKPEEVVAELRATPAASTENAGVAEPKQPPSAANLYRGVGVIEEINLETSTVQINHEEIPDLMPAMSMPLKAKDKSLLAPLVAGDRVEFELNGELVIVAMRKK